jgi:hypothetical protein
MLFWTQFPVEAFLNDMFKRGLMQIVLAVLLLVAQHNALAHQFRHLHDRLPAQTQPQDEKQKAAHNGLCDFHVSFAQVLGVLHSAQLPLRLAANSAEHSGNHFPPAFAANLLVPASRGPPALL